MTYAVRAWRDERTCGVVIGTVTVSGYSNLVAEIVLEAGEVAGFLADVADAALRAASTRSVFEEPLPGPYQEWAGRQRQPVT